METKLLECLLSAVGEGKRADGGFKKQTWDPVLKGLHKAFPEISLEQRKLKKKADCLKDKYRELQLCFNASGFGRDPERNTPTAPPQVWEAYLALRNMSK
jgi:hypothetical protein